MAGLSVVFRAVDEISSKFDDVVSAGTQALNSFDNIGVAADSSCEIISEGTARAAVNIDRVTSATDYWTDKIGSYEREAMQAIYSTEELVDMGYKSAEALEEQQRMFGLCEQSATSLSRAMEATTNVQTVLNTSMAQADETMAKLVDRESISAETKQELEKASMSAMEAMQALAAAQEEAAAAMEAYDNVMVSGTDDLNILENAAERTCHAAEELAEANGKASDAAEELSKATEKASEEAENSEQKGIEAAEGIAGALAAAGITEKVSEMAAAVYDLVMAFSEAESTVVLATGATEDALDGLTESMMDAYAASKTGSLDETASAVGEINTRLGYTNDKLSETTELFLDFAAVTGGNAASSVRSVTQLMNQWNVSTSDLEILLSKLTYAGQASGISVDTLTQQLTSNKAILDQLGFSLDEAIAMFMKFELAGTNTAQVMTGFRTALAKGDIESLEELYDVFDQISSGAMNASEASELFGSRAGSTIVNAVNSGVLSLSDMVGSLEMAGGTLLTTAEAAQTLEQKWTQGSNNISAAFTAVVEPALDGVSSGLADVMNSFGDLLHEHPVVAKIITAFSAGLGAVAIGIAAVSAASLTAIPAVAALGATISAAIWPITLVAAAVATVIAAILFLTEAESETEKAQTSLTTSSQEMADELENLQEQYDALAEAGAADTVEAYQLKNQIDELSEAFENNKQTIGDLIAYNEQLKTTLDEIANTYDETVASIDQNESDSKSLIAQLAAMSESADLSGGQLETMQSIVDRLNGSYEGLNLTLDETNGKLNMSVEDLWAMVSGSAEQERAQANVDKLIGYLEQYQEAQTKYDEAMKSQVAAKAEYERALEEDWAEEHPFLAWSGLADGAEMNWSGSVKSAYHVWDQAKEATNGAKEGFDALTESIKGCYAQMGYSEDEIKEMMEELASATEMAEKLEQEKEAAENTSDGYVEAQNALGQYSEALQLLCEEYDAAYEAALQSIQGQYSLWDEVEDVAAMSSQSIKDALQSQIDYWNSYNENMASLTERASDIEGLSDMLASLADGSEESAAMLAGMESMNDADLSAVVQQYTDLQTAQSETAASVADLETEFSEKLENMRTEMGDMVDGMDLSAEAKANAKATMDAYVSEIQAGVAKAQTAIDSLNFSNNTLSSGGYHGYATGTLDAEPGLALVGEEGPELVNFGGGEVVYTASETSNILTRGNNNGDFYVSPPEEIEGGGDSGEKTITLRIEGAGEMKVSGSGTSKENIVNVLVENMRGVLMDILRQEIMEEGEMSYEF